MESHFWKAKEHMDGMHDPDVMIAREKNDLDAYRESQTWLMGKLSEDFFVEGL